MGERESPLQYTLSKRLLSYILLCSAAFAMLATAVQLYSDYEGDVSEIGKRIQQIQSSYSESIASSLWLVDREQVYLQLQGILELPDVEYIRLSAVDDQDYEVGVRPETDSVIEHSFDIAQNEGGEEQLLGRLHLVVNLNNVYARLIDKAVVILFTQMVKTMMVSLFILFIIRAMVTRHLNRMADYAKNLNLNNLDEPLALSRRETRLNKNDELAYVVRALNEMREAMQEDMQKRELAEKALSASRENYRALYDHNPSMFFTVNFEGELISVNEFGARQLGYDVQNLVGQPIGNLYRHGDSESVIYQLSKEHIEEGKLHRRDVQMVAKDGSPLWVRETARVINGRHGENQVLIVSEDISEARQLSNQLSHQASHDALTGLVNRGEFERRLRQLVERAHVDDSGHALLYLDLDQFKIINDTCGHVAGDELLRQLAGLLKHKVRKGDTLARLGGDEFGVLVENCTMEDAERLAQTMCDVVASFQFFWGVSSFRIGVSIGLASIASGSGDYADIMSQADSACYAAKDLGRNRVHIYRENDAELARRFGEMQWVSKIESTLEQDRFELYFQPIVPIDNTRLDGRHYEVLVRMRDVDGNIVPPASFMSAAERYNLMGRIDRKVVSQTLRWLSLHPDHLKNLSVCSVNLSGQTLMDDDFLEFIFDELKQWNVDPRKLCFEVTETAAIENLTKASDFIRSLKDRGCKFSLDDFGSGLSSFAYLKNLPVDYIKIDGLFVRDIVKDPIDYSMVRSINEIAQVMGKKTVAEFVEDELILNALRNIGVDYAQGYYISRDQPISRLVTD
ncbi:PAS sensor diguanylate cyclase and phophodiesterase [gamma proteobacterium HTCC5015]|nr:PAS sensor diguanylate cyclase and phophodiesterase [gamma proteobacterium HTCC5015]